MNTFDSKESAFSCVAMVQELLHKDASQIEKELMDPYYGVARLRETARFCGSDDEKIEAAPTGRYAHRHGGRLYQANVCVELRIDKHFWAFYIPKGDLPQGYKVDATPFRTVVERWMLQDDSLKQTKLGFDYLKSPGNPYGLMFTAGSVGVIVWFVEQPRFVAVLQSSNLFTCLKTKQNLVIFALISASQEARKDIEADYLRGLPHDPLFEELVTFEETLSRGQIQFSDKERALVYMLLDCGYVNMDNDPDDTVEELMNGGKKNSVLICAGASKNANMNDIGNTVEVPWSSLLEALVPVWAPRPALPETGVRVFAASGSIIVRIQGLDELMSAEFAFAIEDSPRIAVAFFSIVAPYIQQPVPERPLLSDAMYISTPGLDFVRKPTRPVKDMVRFGVLEASDVNDEHIHRWTQNATSVLRVLDTLVRTSDDADAPAVFVSYINSHHHFAIDRNEEFRPVANRIISACRKSAEITKILDFSTDLNGSTIITANDTHGARARFIVLCANDIRFRDIVSSAIVAFHRLGVHVTRRYCFLIEDLHSEFPVVRKY